MTLSAPIAYIGGKRQVHVIDRSGTDRAMTVPDSEPVWGMWSSDASKTSSHSWPSWSPNGQYLACFRVTAQGQSARVLVSEVSGVRAAEVADLGARLPIYLYWSPNGKRIAVLTQDRENLHLSCVEPGVVDRESTLAHGSPLFFTWAGPDKVAAYIGGSDASTSRVALLDTSRIAPTMLLPRIPGNFCAPVWCECIGNCDGNPQPT